MLKIKRFRSSDELLWDEFVPTTNNGTLFHLRRFLNYHADDRFKDHSLFVTKKNSLFSVFPAAEKILKGDRILFSHPGASMGSFAVPENLSIADAISLSNALVKYAANEKFDGIRITLPPTLYQKRLSNYLDFAFFKQGFEYVKREVTSILFLENTLEQNLEKFRPSHRRAVRSAQDKGVEVCLSEDYATFYELLEKNLNIRHGVSPTHSLEEILDLKSRFPDRVNLFGAFIDEKMIAGILNFIVNEHVVLAFYISHDENYQEYRAVNYLFYSIFDWAIQIGFKVYDFGIFTVNEKPNMGLGRFKENFGASGIFRDTIELKLT